MGITLESMDIHTPSIPNPPISTTEQSLNVLLEEKVILEGTLARLNEILENNGVGRHPSFDGSGKLIIDMSTPLVDPNGFPRDDIDIAQIRVVRSQIIHLRNDYKGLMSRIEKGLHALHAENRNATQQSSTPIIYLQTSPSTTVAAQLIPFALVNAVTESSPAAEAVCWLREKADCQGLRHNDQIVKFGTVYAHNNGKLARLAEIVQNSEGREIDVVVLREEIRLSIKLTPRSGWGGRGTLGCHLLPI